MTFHPNGVQKPSFAQQHFKHLFAMLHGNQNVTILSVTPIVLYFVCAVHLCKTFARYVYFPRVSRRNRTLMRRILLVISLFNTVIIWAMFVSLLKHYMAERKVTEKLTEEDKLNDEEAIELLIMYSVALLVVSFVYFTELKSSLSAFYQNFAVHRAISSELGRSVHYLLVPPNAALQTMLTTFDRFYTQRQIYSRLPTLQHRRPFNSTSLSETGAARHRPVLRAPKLMGPLPIRPSSLDLQLQPNNQIQPPRLDIIEPNRAPPRQLPLIHRQTIRRCVSLESMPIFLPEYVT